MSGGGDPPPTFQGGWKGRALLGGHRGGSGSAFRVCLSKLPPPPALPALLVLAKASQHLPASPPPVISSAGPRLSPTRPLPPFGCHPSLSRRPPPPKKKSLVSQRIGGVQQPRKGAASHSPPPCIFVCIWVSVSWCSCEKLFGCHLLPPPPNTRVIRCHNHQGEHSPPPPQCRTIKKNVGRYRLKTLLVY